MHKKLTWNAIGLEPKTEQLIDQITKERDVLPKEKAKDYRKLQGYLEELQYLLDTIQKIKLDLIPQLESKFRIKFHTPELISLALARPSIRGIFQDLNIHYEEVEIPLLNPEQFEELASSGDAANVLALLGDAALDLAVVQSLWDSSLATAGKLTQKRATIVSNQNLASFCDKFHLFDYRLKRRHDVSAQHATERTVIHEKGTLVEALFGVIYLEFGFDEFARILPFLQ